MVELGLAERRSQRCYRLLGSAKSFGGILERYVARELARRFGFDVVTGVKLHAQGVGEDLDVVASAEGKLAYLELKSSPPEHIAVRRGCRFFRSVEDDNMNILCLGGRTTAMAVAWDCTRSFLNAKFSDADRHRRRLAKVLKLEESRMTSVGDRN